MTTHVQPITDSSSDRPLRILRHLMAVPLLALLIAMSACGSSSPNTPTPSSTSTTDTPATKADCSPDAILPALPTSATMIKFDCARAGDAEWAAAQVNPGNTVFFLQWNGSGWDAEDSDSICGSASAGLPQKLLAYCQASPATTSPAPSTTPTSSKPVTAPCTSAAIVAALPNGSSMEKFTCADVGGTTWAAARVSPGNTVFFLQWNGSAWDAEDSDSICGTATAGLPQKLLAYCR